MLAAFAAAGFVGTPSVLADMRVSVAADVAAEVKVPMTIAASTDANPDATGRPSPVVLRVYQLKGDGAFSRAEFFAWS